jgi:hypothetical protein
MADKTHVYLPPEIIEKIAYFLIFLHPPTLLNLRLASKTYNACSRPAVEAFLFHDVKIVVPKDRDLAEIVDRIAAQLESADSFRHVRQVFIVHTGSRSWGSNEWQPPRLSDLQHTYTTQYTPSLSNEVCGHIPKWGNYLGNYPSRSLIPESTWKPIVDLMKQLPALTDLVWHYPEQFPSCILETLHEHLPQCRLRLDSVWLRSLDTPGSNLKELAIISSPSLYSIKMGAERPGIDVSNPRRDLILHLLRLAPNLKEIKLKGFTPRESAFQEQSVPSPRASLRKIDMRNCPILGHTMGQLSHYIDFSVLQDLHLAQNPHHGAADRWDAKAVSFPSLKTLSVCMCNNKNPETKTSFWDTMGSSFPSLQQLTVQVSWNAAHRTAAFYASLRTFLSRLPPLSTLTIAGWHALVSVHSIVSIHGPRLRLLHLTPSALFQSLNEDDIRVISKYCPVLENLEITINRSQSDQKEVALYKALGSMRNLQYLGLEYDLRPPKLRGKHSEDIDVSSEPLKLGSGEASSDPSFDLFENKFCGGNDFLPGFIRNGHVREAMIDCVIDKALACSIFETISSAKPFESPLLQNLTLNFTGRNWDLRMYWFVDRFASTWSIHRDLRDGFRQCLIAEEGIYNEASRNEHLPEWLEPVFDRVYPPGKSTHQPRKQSKKLAVKRRKEKLLTPATWWGRVHSFPLATD